VRSFRRFNGTQRNIVRFPEDFMFQLSAGEFANLKSQIVTSSWGGLCRATPYAFTEQGVAMLSSMHVLRSQAQLRERTAQARAAVAANRKELGYGG